MQASARQCTPFPLLGTKNALDAIRRHTGYSILDPESALLPAITSRDADGLDPLAVLHLCFNVTDEFPAHSSQVTCLRVGQRHGNILVTGGEDRKVHLWEVGNTNPLLTLAGHTHSVTGIAIDSPEHLVVAGCANGSLKLWDLEQGKAIRSFMGHRSAIDTLQFHPLDDYFVSAASGEPSVKVWDLKRKTSVLTIADPTGLHADLVRFTPDGRYLLTSNCTSQSTGSSAPVCANVWDMSTGRLVHRFMGSPALRICFHPRELVMSTLATDGSLTVWDMETYAIISQGPALQDASVYPLFTLDGSQLLGVAADGVAMHNWDPLLAHASTMPVAPASPTAWADAVVVPVGNAEHIVAAGISDSYVHVMQMHFSSSSTSTAAAAHMSSSAAASTTISGLPPLPPITSPLLSSTSAASQPRRSSIPSIPDTDRPPITLSSASLATDATPAPGTPRGAGTHTPRENGAGTPRESGATPTAPLSRAGSALSVTLTAAQLARPMSRSLSALDDTMTAAQLRGAVSVPSGLHQEQGQQSVVEDEVEEVVVGVQEMQVADEPPALKREGAVDTSSPPPPAPISVDVTVRKPGAVELKSASTQMTPVVPVPPPAKVDTASSPMSAWPASNTPMHQPVSTQTSPPASSILPHSSSLPRLPTPAGAFLPLAGTPNKLLGLDISALARGSIQKLPLGPTIDTMADQHAVTVAMLMQRRQLIHQLAPHWDAGNLKGMVAQATSMARHDVWVDVLRTMSVRAPKGWTLDVCVGVLPWCAELMFEPFEDYLEAACEAVHNVLRHFAPLISETLAAYPLTGIDFSREERMEKCSKCKLELLQLKQIFSELASTPGPIGTRIRAVLDAFPSHW